jgi:foldase protein PrsA
MLRHRLAVAAFIVALGVLPGVAGCAGQDKTVVSVNGEKITKGQLDNRLEGQAGKSTLQQMVDTALVLQYGKTAGITVTDAEIQDALNALEQRFPAGQFETILKNQGLTMDDAKNIERVQIIVKKAVDKQVNISDAQVADFFSKNKANYNTPEQIRARHILVKTKPEADAVEAQLRSGANFAVLAQKMSIDPGSKAQGGELGWFGPTQMVKPFSDAAYALAVGQISQPVQTPFGWHIIQLEEKRPAHTASLADAAPKVRQMLLQQAEAAQSGPFIEQLRQKANVQIYDDRFNPLFPPTPAPQNMAPAPTPAPTK